MNIDSSHEAALLFPYKKQRNCLTSNCVGHKDASKILTKSKVTEFENKMRYVMTEEEWKKCLAEYKQLGFELPKLTAKINYPNLCVLPSLGGLIFICSKSELLS